MTIATLSKYDIAAIAAMNGLEGDDYHKLTAAEQRELFGFVVFGRKSVNFESDGQGTVHIASTACFGTDGNVTRLSYEQFAEYVNEQRKIDQ
jgi:hypothetical protein